MDRGFAFLTLLVAVVLAGCDGFQNATPLLAPTGTATLHASDGSWTVTTTARQGGVELFEGSDGQIDATFAAPRLHVGKALLAQGSSLSLTSLRTLVGNALSFESPSADVRVQGVRKSRVVVDLPGPADGTAGFATEEPTSVHRRLHCQRGSCMEIIEYDYEGAKTGTSTWRAEPHPPVEVDRVRVVAGVPKGSVLSSSIRLSGFESLTLRMLD